MARKVDAEADPASKAILDQLQTKTVGAPPSSTGLTGDQLPETIFDVDDFDTVKNQVTLQLSNLELLNVLNTIGQVTNTQSQSGPISGTAKATATAVTGDSTGTTVFAPDTNQVWELDTASVTHSGGAGATIRTRLLLIDSTNGGEVEIGDESVASNTVPFDPKGNYGPVRITSDVVLKMKVTGTTGGNEETSTVNVSVIRVR